MRTLLALSIAALLLPACKKRPQPTMPLMPDSSLMGGGGNTELPEGTLFHAVYRTSGHANQVHAFFRAELEQRGAKQVGDVWQDENLVHTGGFAGDGTASAKDPTRPGIYLAVAELPNETRFDVWEMVPNPQ
jgi:hypothetical protein